MLFLTHLLSPVWLQTIARTNNAHNYSFTHFSFLGACQRLLLFTIFALSVKYEPVDIALAVHTGMLPLVARLCGSPAALSRANQAIVYDAGHSQLPAVLQVASIRLLQVLAVTAG